MLWWWWWGGGSQKTIYRGNCPKRGLGQFADFRGAGQKIGEVMFLRED